MKKILLAFILPFCCSLSVFAQPNDLMIIYDANQGVSGLVGANKVYMYSGAVTSGPSGQWEWITGSVNLDDGVGLMTPIGNNVWTICIDPAVYYGTAFPILAIDIIFRNENGTAFGYDFNGTYTILDMTTPTPTSSFAGVTTTNCGVGLLENSGESVVLSNYPNPMKSSTTFIYSLPQGLKKATLNLFETTGKKIKTFELNPATPGIHQFEWHNEELVNNIYYYTLELDGALKRSKKLILAR